MFQRSRKFLSNCCNSLNSKVKKFEKIFLRRENIFSKIGGLCISKTPWVFLKYAAPFYFTISSLISSNFKLITWLAESRPMVTP